jgi:hypothetical protein
MVMSQRTRPVKRECRGICEFQFDPVDIITTYFPKIRRLCVSLVVQVAVLILFFTDFLGWGETESTCYVGHYLAYCTSPV